MPPREVAIATYLPSPEMQKERILLGSLERCFVSPNSMLRTPPPSGTAFCSLPSTRFLHALYAALKCMRIKSQNPRLLRTTALFFTRFISVFESFPGSARMTSCPGAVSASFCSCNEAHWSNARLMPTNSVGGIKEADALCHATSGGGLVKKLSRRNSAIRTATSLISASAKRQMASSACSSSAVGGTASAAAAETSASSSSDALCDE